MNKKWFIGLLSLACVIFVCFCYLQVVTPVKITIGLFAGNNWGVPEEDSYTLIEKAADRFTSTYDNTEVHYETGITSEEYEDWLSMKILGGDAPDIMLVPGDMYATLVENGTLENLDEYIFEEQYSLQNYYPAVRDACMSDGSYYALPYEAVPELMFANKTLLEQSGIDVPGDDWSWDDLYEIASTLTKDTDGDGKTDQFGICGYTWEEAAYGNGVSFYNEEKQSASFSTFAMVETVEFLRKLSALAEEEVTERMFDEGKVAFMPMNYSDYRSYMPYPYRVKKFSGFEWECLPMPKGPEGENVSRVDTLMIGMYSRSNHKELAWELMKYLSGNFDFQKEIAITSPSVSVLQDVMRDEEVKEVLEGDVPGSDAFSMDVLDAVMEKGVYVHETSEYNQVVDTAGAQINELIHNEQDIENNLVLLERSLNEYLRK